MFWDITNYLHELGTAARRAGVQLTPLQDCANNCNATLGHNMFFYITDCMLDRNFPFSIFNLNKLPLGRNVLLILQTIMHNAQKNVKNFTNI